MLPGQHSHGNHHLVDQFTEHYLATDQLPQALMRTYTSQFLVYRDTVKFCTIHCIISAFFEVSCIIIAFDKLFIFFFYFFSRNGKNYPTNGFLLCTIHTHSLSLWTGCENMGGSNEFFDKFSVRYHISTILIHLWEQPAHHACIIAESRYNNVLSIYLVKAKIHDANTRCNFYSRDLHGLLYQSITLYLMHQSCTKFDLEKDTLMEASQR